MSRKRAFSQTTPINPTQPLVGVCRCRYYSPGLYPTFQVARESSPYTNEASLYECPLQWELYNKAAYVVDSHGIVHYLSDLGSNLKLSNNQMLDNDANISYHYECDESERNYMEQDDEEEPDVRPYKRERYNTDSDDNDTDTDTEVEDDTITQSIHSESFIEAARVPIMLLMNDKCRSNNNFTENEDDETDISNVTDALK